MAGENDKQEDAPEENSEKKDDPNQQHFKYIQLTLDISAQNENLLDRMAGGIVEV